MTTLLKNTPIPLSVVTPIECQLGHISLKLERNGIKSNFTALPNENELVSLHGGPKGFDTVNPEV